MAKVKITKRSADNLGADGNQDTLWDAVVPGFGLRLRKGGKKSFILKYRFNNRQRWHTIGTFGAPWNVESARHEANKLLMAIHDGIEPAAERDHNKNAKTVADLCDLYLQNHARVHKKPRSWRADQGNIENHVIRLIGNLNINAVARRDIEQLKRDIASGKTARNLKTKPRVRLRVKGGPGAANRTLALMSKMFNLAEQWGLRDEFTNPVRGVRKFPEKRCQRFLSDDEVSRLGKVLNQAPLLGLADEMSVAAIKLLLFTGCRLSEILTLKWAYVDFQRYLLNLPDSKTGAKAVFLPPIAVEVLKSISPAPGNPYVLNGPGVEGHLINLRKPWHRIREFAGLPDVRLHDLRHSFASIAAGEGISLHIVGQLLGHTQPATTARYAHLAARPTRAAAEQIGLRIGALMAEANGSSQIG